MPETPYPENEHDKLPEHSAAWYEGFAAYARKIPSFARPYRDLEKGIQWLRGWLAAQAEDEAVDGSDKDLGS